MDLLLLTSFALQAGGGHGRGFLHGMNSRSSFFLTTFTEYPLEEFVPTVEVFLIDETNALSSEGRLGEIAVVGLVINLQCQVAVWYEQVAHVKVAYKA